jgi:hypothetical protein
LAKGTQDLNWEKLSIWTNTLYTLVHSLNLAKEQGFGCFKLVDDSFRNARNWVTPDCSYESVLLEHESGGKKLTFRKDPNETFKNVSRQIINMLIQDLVVIFDEMMSEVLNQRNQTAGEYPKSKIEKLTTYLDSTYKWSSYGCTELVAVRNVLAHNNGIWNKKSIDYVIPFIEKPPLEGDALSVGFSMLFYYRKAIRTFLNEVKIT